MTRDVGVAVIGAGPAGLAAARVIAEAGVDCLLIDKMGPGGELMNLGEVRDVPGLEQGATGADLLAQLVDGVLGAGVELAVDEVVRVDGLGPFALATSEGQVTAQAVVIASGRDKGTTGVAGEERFEGRGLSHCAHCDGPLYSGKPVVVAGDDRWAVEEAIVLAGEASVVTLACNGAFRAIPDDRKVALAALSNLTVLAGSVAALHGNEILEAVTVDKERVPAAGLFILTNRSPATSFLHGLLDCGVDGHIDLRAGSATSVPGIFTCGDVANPVGCIVSAIAEGEEAGHNAARWVKGHAQSC